MGVSKVGVFIAAKTEQEFSSILVVLYRFHLYTQLGTGLHGFKSRFQIMENHVGFFYFLFISISSHVFY